MKDNSLAMECLVCSTPNTSLHFGIDACRACAAFFKRATLLGRRYPCRQGQRKCEVTRDTSVACRGCRFDRCVAVGMKYDGPMRAVSKQVAQPEEEVDSTNEPSTSTDSLLDKIQIAYEKTLASREQKELTILRQSDCAQRVPYLPQEVYTGTSEKMHTTFFQITADEVWNFCRDAFPFLNELPQKEQTELFRAYWPNFFLIDTYSRTWKIWKGFDWFILVSASVCLDVQAPESWMNVQDAGENGNEMLELATLHVRDQMARLAPPFEKADLTERETHALLALALCEPDLKTESSECLLSLLEVIREKTLSELQVYYRVEMKRTDYSARLCNLMTICHAVRECNSHFQEYFRTHTTLFDVYSLDTQLRDLLL